MAEAARAYHKRDAIPAAIATIARCEARDAIKAELKAQGHKLSEYAPRDITKLAQAYLAEHPEVFDLAAAIVQRWLCKSQH